ncbi:MAG: hypothetical protein KatS3mg031_0313 [Chitinophagales bacterium]|nr:MAG: hypothetical protein KatS3mg031_0313 [Chitinophagales bacterium]
MKTTMTAARFNRLMMDAKANFLWDNGVYVGERVSYNKYLIKIYSLMDFYVEVYYGMEDNKIEDIYAIETEEDWEGFLKTIDLRELF